MKPDEINTQHMERVRATLRRSAFERVLSKIAYYEARDRAVTEGINLGRYRPDDPPLSDHERDMLKYLRELRDSIRTEMIKHR